MGYKKTLFAPSEDPEIAARHEQIAKRRPKSIGFSEFNLSEDARAQITHDAAFVIAQHRRCSLKAAKRIVLRREFRFMATCTPSDGLLCYCCPSGGELVIISDRPEPEPILAILVCMNCLKKQGLEKIEAAAIAHEKRLGVTQTSKAKS